MATTWTEFWDRKTTIYVNDRHSLAHYQAIAANIVAHVSSPNLTVVDYGSGAALSADAVASACRHLWLVDKSESVRRNLKVRFGSNPKISVADPDRLGMLGSGTVDVFIANSVVQYMSKTELETALREWRRILAANGVIIIADIVPPDASAVHDAGSLLKFAVRNHFAAAAVRGLVQTLFSDYRVLRSKLGLTTYNERQILAILQDCGLDAKRLPRNFGHNDSRFAVIASFDGERRCCSSKSKTGVSGKQLG